MLTLEQLRNLKSDEWIWVEASQVIDSVLCSRKTYVTNFSFTEKYFLCGAFLGLKIKDYGETWKAYRNKEEAEGYHIVKDGDTVYELGQGSDRDCFLLHTIGRDVFLSHEAAEAKLKENK